MLDEPQVKLFWGVLHGHLSEDIYWGLRTEWHTLKDNLYKQSKDGEVKSKNYNQANQTLLVPLFLN